MIPEVHRLIEQLSPPLEPPSWPESTAHPTERVLALPDEDSSFALVIWVKLVKDAITLLPAPGPAIAAIGLQRLATAPGRQLLKVNRPPADASHLLVMGWTRQRRAPSPWARKLFDHPYEPSMGALEALIPFMAPHVVQGALTELLKTSPATIKSSLLALPAPVPTALFTEALGRHGDSLRALLTTPDPETRSSGMYAPMSVVDPAQQKRLEATSLVFASCQYPAGLLDHRAASASFRRMEETAASQGPLDALLLLGDQIYADATYGILDPSGTSDHLDRLYIDLGHALDQYPTLSEMRKQIEPRLYVTPDDHEIRDNWEPGGLNSNKTDMHVALAVFDRWRLSRTPPKQLSGGYWGVVNAGGGHQVFMLDTRTKRDPRPWGPGTVPHEAHIMDGLQRQALEQWLRERQHQDGGGPVSPKLISSPVWLLPRRVGRAGGPDETASRSDSWDGYTESLHRLLGFLATERIRGVVMLCGDAHLAGHTRVALKHKEHAVQLHILHAPALYAPFPFANGQPHHYRCHRDEWQWANGSISSHVESELWALGDGFVHLSVVPVGNTWQVRATFDTGLTCSRSDFWTVN